MQKTEKLHPVYTIDQASRLAGLSRERLADWDRAGFFQPEYADKNRRLPLSRLYSFDDIVGLKTIAYLRDRHHVSMKELRKVAEVLARETSRPWSDLRLTAVNRNVVQIDERGQGSGVLDGQKTCIQLSSVIEEVQEAAQRLRIRDPKKQAHVEKNKFVMHNVERFSGTRIPVSAVERYIREGADDAEVLSAYPDLTEKDVQVVRARIRQTAA